MRRLAALAGLFLVLSAPEPGTARPNVIIFVADDLGYSDIGSYGGEIETPTLDRLAGAGVRFTQFYVTPRCSPTRAALLSGVWSHEAGVGHLNNEWGHPGYLGRLSERVLTMAEALAPAGYSSYLAGKWHLASEAERDDPEPAGWPRQRGFDRFYGTIYGSGSYFDPPSLVLDNQPVEPEGKDFYYTDAISSWAVRFLSRHLERRPGAPFFLLVAYTAPHWPLHARPEDIARYAGRYDRGWDLLRQERYRRLQELGIVQPEWRLSPRDAKVEPWNEVSHKAWEARRMEVYAAMVDRMDQGIGRIVRTLEEGGVLDDTLIFFLTDNGANGETFAGVYRVAEYFLTVPESSPDGRPVRFGDDPAILAGGADTYQTYGRAWANLSNTPFRLFKHWTHEGGIAGPLIVHWPRGVSVEAGSLIRRPAHVVDLLPTVLEAAGTGYPKRVEGGTLRPLSGRSLLPLLEGGDRPAAPLFWEHEGNRAVRHGRWKLVSRWPRDWELYDLVADRTELTDLADQHPEQVRELEALYAAWAEEAQVGRWPLVVPHVRSLLWATGAAVFIVLALLLASLASSPRRRRGGEPGSGS